MIIVAVAPTMPADISGARTRPNSAIATVTAMRVRRRPPSAMRALSGMVAAKNTMPTSWMIRNTSRV
ncbi:hypothetical protein D3C83_236720 [compost metagenome]